jgi:hypothetical protein
MIHTLRSLGLLVLLTVLAPSALAFVGTTPGPIGTGPDERGRPAGCSLSFNGDPTATVNGGGTSVSFAGRAVNAGPGAKSVLFRVNYARAGGGPSGILPYGPVNLGPTDSTGVPFKVNQRIPGSVPPGTYLLIFELVDGASGATCDTAPGIVVLTAPATGGSAGWTAAPAVDFFAAEANPDPVTPDPVALRPSPSPNPFSGRTTLAFEIAQAAPVRLAVYDVLGREVVVLVDGPLDTGRHEAVFDARALAAGTYVYRLTVGEHVHTGRLTVAR